MKLQRRELLCALVLGGLGCRPRTSTSGPIRCAHCGMRVASDSHWQAGGVTSRGAVLFDTPGCLFRYQHSARGADLHDPWVTEYYGEAQVHVMAQSMKYVAGSDVIGPMGPDLVPVRADRVEMFRREHKGANVYSYDEALALPEFR